MKDDTILGMDKAVPIWAELSEAVEAENLPLDKQAELWEAIVILSIRHIAHIAVIYGRETMLP